jgi:N-acetylglucosamine repressor
MQSLRNRTGAKVGTRTVREANRALLFDLIRREGALTRSDLARRSALAKPTVSAIVNSLIEENLVCEIGPGASSLRGGPRGMLLNLNPDAAAFAGVHFAVGSTSIAIADACGRVRARMTTGSYRGDAAGAFRELPDLVDRMMSDARLPRDRLRRVGVAVPGLVDHRTGECVLAPNLGWRNVPLRASLKEVLGASVVVRNSMQAGAIAEARLAGSPAARSFAWIYMGQGIGAAIVIDGRLVYGKRGYTGELGHWQVVRNGPPCQCGRRGCLETVASGRAVEAAACALSEGVGVAGDESEKRGVAQMASVARAKGKADARRVLWRAGEYLGLAISYLINLLDLEMVVLDGAAIRVGDDLIDTIRTSVATHSLDGAQVRIVKSTVGDDAMLLGALNLAMEGDLLDGILPESDAYAHAVP